MFFSYTTMYYVCNLTINKTYKHYNISYRLRDNTWYFLQRQNTQVDKVP